MQAEASGFIPALCEWCTSPSKHCPLHIPNIVPYREPDPSSIYNELSNRINPSEAGGESSMRVPDSTMFAETQLVPYREFGPSSFHNEVIDRINPFDSGGGESSTRLPDSSIFSVPEFGEPGLSSLHNEVVNNVNPSDAARGETSTAENPRSTVASVAQVAASNSRRKTDSGRFPCPLCLQTFTAKHNVQSQYHSAPLKFRTY